MDKGPPAEEHPYDPPEGEPNPLLALSVKMGIDLTPHGDLEERLDAMVEGSRAFQKDLEALKDTVKSYEQTVEGLDPVDEPSTEN